MFSTKGQEVKAGSGITKSLQPGVVLAHIYDAKIKSSERTGKKMLEFILEGPTLPAPFEGWAIDKDNQDGPKFKGQSSRVGATIWTENYNDDDINKNEILNRLVVIAQKLGLKNKLDNISEENQITSIEQWVEKAVEILKGHDLYWFLKGTEEEYNGKTIVKLSLPKYKFCGNLSTDLDIFDKNNQYHFKPLAQAGSVKSFEAAANDFDL
jgi:hypothetical protein